MSKRAALGEVLLDYARLVVSENDAYYGDVDYWSKKILDALGIEIVTTEKVVVK